MAATISGGGAGADHRPDRVRGDLRLEQEDDHREPEQDPYQGNETPDDEVGHQPPPRFSVAKSTVHGYAGTCSTPLRFLLRTKTFLMSPRKKISFWLITS